MPLFANHPAAPLRPVDWRWRVALCVSSGQPHEAGAYTDRAIESAVGYLRATAEKVTSVGVAATGVTGAVGLRNGSSALRAEVEARLLAGQTPAEAAAQTGVAVDTVIWYQDLYFDVADRLGNASAVRHLAIGYPDPGDVEAAEAVFLRAVGHGLGPAALDLVLRHLHAPRPQIPDDLRAAGRGALEDLYDWASVRLMWLAYALEPADDREKLKLLAAIGPRGPRLRDG